MDNQQDQFGANNPVNPNRPVQNPAATPPNPGAGRANPNAADSTASGAAAASRKSAVSPNAQHPAGAPNQPASPGADRQREGQTNKDQDGKFLDTALTSSKKWIEDSGIISSVSQLPQSLKELGSRAVARVNDLTTTQKVVGGTLLAVGLGWLATRKSRLGSSDEKDSTSIYNRQNKGGYGRSNFGYQAPDAAASRRPAGRSDSGAPYGSASQSTGSTPGVFAGSGRANSNPGTGASANVDHGTRSAESSYRSKNDDFRSIE